MKRFILAMFLVIGGLLLTQPVFALTVSPVKIEVVGSPGETVKSKILLENEHMGAKTFYSSFESFEATGETGVPTFVPAEQGLATWIETAPQITLEPGEQKEVPLTIKIPEDADPGGHFAVIFLGTSSPESKEGGAVSVASKVGILVLLKVTGEIEEGGGVLEFGAEDKQKFFNSLPVNFMFRFQNSGSDRVKPAGEITIKNIFGKTLVVLPANETEGNVLPQSIRKFKVEWNPNETEIINKTETTEKKSFLEELKNEKENFAFGKYTAELDLEYGEEKAQASFSFFVIPWRILTLALLILIVVILIVIKGVKKYNQRMIAKAVKVLEEARAAEINKTEETEEAVKTKKNSEAEEESL